MNFRKTFLFLIVATVGVAGEANMPPPQNINPEAVKMWATEDGLNVVIICPEDGTVLAEFTIHKHTIAAYTTKRGVDSTKMVFEELKKAVLEYKAKKGDK